MDIVITQIQYIVDNALSAAKPKPELFIIQSKSHFLQFFKSIAVRGKRYIPPSLWSLRAVPYC